MTDRKEKIANRLMEQHAEIRETYSELDKEFINTLSEVQDLEESFEGMEPTKEAMRDMENTLQELSEAALDYRHALVSTRTGGLLDTYDFSGPGEAAKGDFYYGARHYTREYARAVKWPNKSKIDSWEKASQSKRGEWGELISVEGTKKAKIFDLDGVKAWIVVDESNIRR